MTSEHLVIILNLPENIIYWEMFTIFKVRKGWVFEYLVPSPWRGGTKRELEAKESKLLLQAAELGPGCSSFIWLDVENMYFIYSPLFISKSFETWKAIRLLRTLLLQVIVSSSVIKFNWQTKPSESHQWSWMDSLQNGELSSADILY